LILRAVNPYKQEVAGSSPALPTILSWSSQTKSVQVLFFLAFLKLWVVLMKRSALLLCASLLVSIGALAQSSDEGMHTPDGGTIERFNSILIPPVLHAPFLQHGDRGVDQDSRGGGTLTVQNHRLVVCDSAGRIYQERRRLVPKGSEKEPDLQRIEISDPSTHKKYFCRTETHVCTLEDYTGPKTASVQPGVLRKTTLVL
jgi:hypothetical protein